MDLQSSLYAFVEFGLYSAWLIGGAIDYWCHRRSDIERTSGPGESWFHLAEYFCVAVIVALAMLWKFSGWVLALATFAAVVHTVLSYVDVKTTVGRRFISALEQHAHALMIVVPLVAVCLLGIMESEFEAPARRLQPAWQRFALLFTIIVSGALIVEELTRPHRVRA